MDLNGERCRICGSKETTVLANASCKCHSTCDTGLNPVSWAQSNGIGQDSGAAQLILIENQLCEERQNGVIYKAAGL